VALVLGGALLVSGGAASGDAVTPVPGSAEEQLRRAADKPVDSAGPWPLGVEAGRSVVGVRELSAGDAWLVGVFGARQVGRWFELEVDARYQTNDRADSLDLFGGIRFRYRYHRLSAAVGPKLGATLVSVHDFRGSLWTQALLVNVSAELRYLVAPRIELRLNVLSATVYYRDIWMPCWEPSFGVAMRF
jgi:hypothetical protein